ncbi:MAG: acyltransferase family protein [Verrucomicrobiota bacterium]
MIRVNSVMAQAKTYFHQLDALRGIACIMVLFHHLVPGASKHIALGPLGVRLFFVMTGFLLVGNLLQQKERGHRPLTILKVFYQKRGIRILPVYFLAFAILCLLGSESAIAVWPWISTFTINLHMGLTGEWPGNLSHYWFLATCEQMVFALALILLWLPGRYLVPALVLLFVGAGAHRLLGTEWGLEPMMVWFSPLSSLDSIAVGALLGLFYRKNSDAISGLFRKPWVGVSAWLLLAAGTLIRMRFSSTPLIHFAETLEAIFFGWLILRAAVGFSGPAGKFLANPVLVYTGMISYALYIFHPILHGFVATAFQKLGLPHAEDHPGVIAGTFAATFLAGTLSWYLLEKPLAALKPKAGSAKA